MDEQSSDPPAYLGNQYVEASASSQLQHLGVLQDSAYKGIEDVSTYLPSASTDPYYCQSDYLPLPNFTSDAQLLASEHDNEVALALASLNVFRSKLPVENVAQSYLSSSEALFSIQSDTGSDYFSKASAQLPELNLGKDKSSEYSEVSGFCIMDLHLMSQTLSQFLMCNSCSTKLHVCEDVSKGKGLQVSLVLVCNSCQQVVPWLTSHDEDLGQRTREIVENGISRDTVDAVLKGYGIPSSVETVDFEPDSSLDIESVGSLPPVLDVEEDDPPVPDPPAETPAPPPEASKSFSCNLCQKKFLRKKNLAHHMKTHRGDYPYACSHCPEKFVLPNHLAKHMKLHDAQRHECPYCHKHFRKTFNLTQHVRIHTGEKPYLCAVCGKSFTDASTFNKHKIGAHSADRPLQCEVCGKSFYHHSHLREHKRSHTGERPFACEVCGKTFLFRNSVKKHMVIHTGSRPFQCKVCGKSFRWLGSLQTHRRQHPGQQELDLVVNADDLGSLTASVPPVTPLFADGNIDNVAPYFDGGSVEYF